MKTKGIIFDLDGTLLYTLEDLKDSTNYALKKLGLEPITIEKTRQFVGNGINNLLKRALGDNIEYLEPCFDIFMKHYKINCKNNTKPYDNITKILEKIKDEGIKLAILSNKVDNSVKELSCYYFKNIFDISMGESAVFPKKPDSKACNYIINEFNLKKDEVIFVGDSEVDIQTAANAGIECISVSWGYKTKEFLEKHNAKKIIDSPFELLDII